MVAHEYAHGYAAMKQGDMTAYEQGRLTWNPLKHIDPFMTVILPVMMWLGQMNSPNPTIFGGAKPVPVNPSNYRNYRRGDIIVSMAGIVTNCGIALLCVPLVILTGMIGHAAPGASSSLAIFQMMFERGVIVNLVLAIFNLLPIPPLDGSHVFKYLLPARLAAQYQRISSAGFLVLFALLYFGRGILNVWFTPMFAVYDRLQALYANYLLPNPF